MTFPLSFYYLCYSASINSFLFYVPCTLEFHILILLMFSYLQSQPCLLLEVPETTHVCDCARCTVPNSVIFTG